MRYVGRDLVSEVWVLGGHDLPAVVVELPDQRGVVSKRLWSGQLLGLVGPPVAACSSAQYTHTFTPLQLRSAYLTALSGTIEHCISKVRSHNWDPSQNTHYYTREYRVRVRV